MFVATGMHIFPTGMKGHVQHGITPQALLELEEASGNLIFHKVLWASSECYRLHSICLLPSGIWVILTMENPGHSVPLRSKCLL